MAKRGKSATPQVQESNGKIKSIAELGLKAESIGIRKKNITRRGKKELEKRAPQIVENLKQCIMIRGNKMSNNMKELLRDIYRTRGDKDESKLFLRNTHDIYPFDDPSKLEAMANKYDSALFVLGNHQKKRPENIIFGRLYAEHLLDMIEFGMTNY